MSNLHREFTNIHTQQKFVKPKLNGVEKQFDGRTMITETDENGVITYASKNFLDFNGYEKKELIGLPHSVLRHPETPKGVYRAMWAIISQKKVWRGYLKNICKDGSSYWALVYIQPKLNENGEIVGYIANRKDAYPRIIIEVAKKYSELQGDEHIDDPYFMQAELYHGIDMASFDNKI